MESPFGVDPRGVAISNQFSKTIDALRDLEFDYVVTLCGNAKESRPFFQVYTNGTLMTREKSERFAELGNVIVVLTPNYLRPCMIIDNPHVMREVIAKTGARYTHPGAEEIYTTCKDRVDAYAARWGRTET